MKKIINKCVLFHRRWKLLQSSSIRWVPAGWNWSEDLWTPTGANAHLELVHHRIPLRYPWGRYIVWNQISSWTIWSWLSL